MNVADYEVRPLFAEPYFRANISHAISEKQIAFLKSLKMVHNQTNLISENLYIFDEPELGSVKAAVQEALDVYSREVMGISQEIYPTQSWALVNPPGVGMHGHTHSNSIVSGSLYYCALPEPNSRMIFDRHRMYQQIELVPEQDKVNLYNTAKNVVEPKPGDIFLFSSSLHHLVEPNRSGQPRHSIAFNTFVRGRIGNFRDVSELVL